MMQCTKYKREAYVRGNEIGCSILQGALRERIGIIHCGSLFEELTFKTLRDHVMP